MDPRGWKKQKVAFGGTETVPGGNLGKTGDILSFSTILLAYRSSYYLIIPKIVSHIEKVPNRHEK
jgi:hypothetical protein